MHGIPDTELQRRAAAIRLVMLDVDGTLTDGRIYIGQAGEAMKAFSVHDGFGLWLAVRRLHQGRFLWAAAGSRRIELTREQFDALVLGLPWQRLGAAGVINLV